MCAEDKATSRLTAFGGKRKRERATSETVNTRPRPPSQHRFKAFPLNWPDLLLHPWRYYLPVDLLLEELYKLNNWSEDSKYKIYLFAFIVLC